MHASRLPALMEISQSSNNDPASRDQHVVSPYPSLPPLPPVAAANQSNENSADSQQQQDENDECPSQLLCCLTQEPPINGVTFDIPTTSGQISTQVFEHSELYRMIYTRGVLSAYRIVRHPIFEAHVPRELALSFVKPVSTDIQQQMDDERLRQSLSLEEESPLTAADHANMEETIDRMKDPRPRRCEVRMTESEELMPASENNEPERRQRRDPGLPPSAMRDSQVESDSASDSEGWDALMNVPPTNNSRSNHADGRRVRRRLQPRPVPAHRPANASNNNNNHTNNPSRSNNATEPARTSNAAAPSRSARSNNARSNNSAPGRNPQLGGFLNVTHTEIRSQNHATALIGLLQVAQTHPQGIINALGHGKKRAWIGGNLTRFFQSDGPLGTFAPASTQSIQRHLSDAQKLAKSYFTRDHSNDQSGARQEDIPAWARAFFVLFEDEQTASSEATRTLRRQVVSSLVGRQAPLGHHDNAPVGLRTETGANNGTASQRAQIIGQVSVEERNADDGLDDDSLEGNVEGINDVSNRQPAPIQRTNNGTRRNNVQGRGRGRGSGRGRSATAHRNMHLGGLSADHNDPSARFYNVQNAYRSLDRLGDAVANAFDETRAPPRRMIDVAREYSEVSVLMDNATNERQRSFFTRTLDNLELEMEAMETNNQPSSNQNNNDSTESNPN